MAVTFCAELIATVHAPVPLQAPLQPANVDPAEGPAANATEVPAAKLALHVPPQLIPAGELVTVPKPLPALATLNASGGESQVFSAFL